jgi:hypothetical protein
MAQLWKLVLLCDLLNGISASLLGDLSGSLSNVDNLKPVVSSGDSTLEGESTRAMISPKYYVCNTKGYH